MAKIIFKQYLIELHGKYYDILVPNIMPKNIWIVLRGWKYKHADGSELLGDREAMQWVKDAYITLALEPDKIIYFPLKDKHPICEAIGIEKAPQLVFYNHNIQLKRREWNDIKRCLKYRKPKQYVVYYHAEELIHKSHKMIHYWKQNKTFYRKRKISEYYEYETVFIEGCKKTALQIAAYMQEQWGKDFDEEAKHSHWITNMFWLGPMCKDWYGEISFGYVNKKNYKNVYGYEEK